MKQETEVFETIELWSQSYGKRICVLENGTWKQASNTATSIIRLGEAEEVEIICLNKENTVKGGWAWIEGCDDIVETHVYSSFEYTAARRRVAIDRLKQEEADGRSQL